MTNITLINSTGVQKVDSLVGEIINRLESNFPERIRGYYMTGSYADNSAIATSDIDMLVVFKGRLNDDEPQHFADLLAECQRNTPIALDIDPVSEEDLLHYGVVSFVRASLLMYGEDIRPMIANEQPLDSFIRGMMHNQYGTLADPRGNPEVLTIPLDYPDPTGEFYGYNDRSMLMEDGTTHYGTKGLVGTVLWLATALTAFKTRQYIVTKRECVMQHRRLINDEWTPLLEAVYWQCRNQWNYFVPDDPVERQQLRALCERTLEFSNYFLECYKEFLLLELQQTNERYKLFAVKRLGQIIYPDPAIPSLLEDLKNNSSEELQLQIDATLQKIRSLFPSF